MICGCASAYDNLHCSYCTEVPGRHTAAAIQAFLAIWPDERSRQLVESSFWRAAPNRTPNLKLHRTRTRNLLSPKYVTISVRGPRRRSLDPLDAEPRGEKLMHKLFIFVGIAVLFNRAGFAAEGCVQGTFPVRSLSGVDLSKPGNLEIAMDALKLDEGNELEFESSYESGHEITKVRTCREYDAAIDQRLLFMTGTQRTPEFLRECRVLRFLKKASAASRSCVDGYKLTPKSPDELPPSLSYFVSRDQEDAVDDAEQANLSWKRFSPEMEFHVLGPTMLTAAGQGEFDKLEVMAFGDFDHDGIQDMLVWTSNYGGGTLVQHEAIVLTRKDKKSMFRTLSRIE